MHLHHDYDFRYSGATRSCQFSQPRDTESLQQSHHRAAYISLADAEIEDPERRVSKFYRTCLDFISTVINDNLSECSTSGRMNRLDVLPRGFGAFPVLEVLDLTYNNLSDKNLPGNFFMMGQSQAVKSPNTLFRKNPHINLSFL